MSTSGGIHSGPPTGAAGGDIAGTGTSTYPNPTLTAIGSATGPVGSSSVTPVVTIDTKGRVTALTSTASGGGGIQVATATLNAAALRTLFSTPTTLIAAPGANIAIIPLSIEYEFKPGVGCVTAPHPGVYFAPPASISALSAGLASLGGLTGVGPPDAEFGFEAPSPSGTYLNTLAVNKAVVIGDYTADAQSVGPIGTVTLNNAGTLYAPGDTGTIATDLYTGGATYVVTTTNGAPGVITGLTVTAAGDGYGVGDTVATATGGAQPGIGVNLALNIATVVGLSFSLYVSVAYRTVTTH